ncbi:MAG: very short patch repair endonuclease [Dehalococcoidia bacterium]
MLPDRLPYPQPTSDAASRVMKGNRKKNTRPEVQLRSVLHALGLRFRKHYRIVLPDLPSFEGDIVFPRQQLVVLVDGCFWHQCPKHSNVPRVNTEYWKPKLERNVQRDRRIDAALQAAGWTVFRVWEHEPPTDAAARIRHRISETGQRGSEREIPAG